MTLVDLALFSTEVPMNLKEMKSELVIELIWKLILQLKAVVEKRNLNYICLSIIKYVYIPLPFQKFFAPWTKPIFLEYLTYWLLDNSKYSTSRGLLPMEKWNYIMKTIMVTETKQKITLPFLRKTGKKLTYSSLLYKHQGNH